MAIASHRLALLQGDGERSPKGAIAATPASSIAIPYIDIIDHKLWIQHDGTEEGIAVELVAAGVPKEDIVLGFRPLAERKHTEFAVS